MKHYDVILAGGGAAGLSLAYHLSQSQPALRLLVVDREIKRYNDHTWCSWLQGPQPFDAVAYRTWERLAFHGLGYDAAFDLAPYRYRMIRATDFYRFIRETFAHRHSVDLIRGDVTRIVDGPEQAEVHVDELALTADWVFDSRYDATEYRPLSSRYHYLVQHFLGWEIETAAPTFDPDVPHLFDFRTPQRGAMRFVYVLPYDDRRALVEYTLFSANLLPQAEYEAALREYLADVLGVTDYRVTEVEQGVIPMTDHPAPRRIGHRVMNIGTRGGRVKPSTGYAFHRIQQDSAAIIRSLMAHGHPLALPTPPSRYRFFDAILLQVLYRRGRLGASVFTALFQHNPIQRIFRFLDEESSWGDDLQIVASVPPGPFIAAWARLKLLRKV